MTTTKMVIQFSNPTLKKTVLVLHILFFMLMRSLRVFLVKDVPAYCRVLELNELKGHF